MNKQVLLQVLRETRALLARPDNDFGWSSWRNAEAALEEMDASIARVSSGATPDDAVQLRVLFAPTGPIQEVSLSSGWGEAFIELADRFDEAMRSG